MEKCLLFGVKKSFAIELGYTKNSRKFYLRLWMQGSRMGAFTKAGELKFSIDTYKKILQRKEDLCFPLFDAMSAQDIFKYVLQIDIDEEEGMASYEAMRHLSELSFFGPQFTNTQSFSLVLYKNNTLHFIWQNDFGAPVYEAKVPFSEFCKIFDEYITYCEGNKLLAE